ncbi:peptide chain release factor 1 [Candidatus Entotheonella palauensis]|uniref:peptide chain release factor 1 n=1 Tax=Candidatus Entotheonella palauensis TaxID=93172 RepID=UPI000B7F7E36|nr:peptide chain release factor 1 [Candidatus Entotheonella palauensis]
MFEQLEATAKRYDELNRLLGDPAVLADSDALRTLAKEQAELRPIVDSYHEYCKVQQELEDNRSLLSQDGLEDDFVELVEEEISTLRERLEALEQDLRLALLPQDPNDARGALIEIRAGTGGDEAALFAAELFRMYSRYAETQRWRMEILSSSDTETGGIKEIVASIEGPSVYRKMKYESGTHRVQRVPVTETQGRIHTSAVTVAILPEAEDVDVDIDPTELRVDVFRSSGPGGQSVNTTDSAVRITYEPKDRKDLRIVVTCQDEKSQHKNRAKAMKVLRARIMDILQDEQQAQVSQQRRAMIGSGDRSERIRTYNFPQGRVTDHRINLTLYKLDHVLQGSLDEVIEALSLADQAAKLQAVGG